MPSPKPVNMVPTATLAPDLARLLDRLSQGGLRLDAALAPYTSFRIGGPADYLARFTRTDHLLTALKALDEAGVPFLLLGGGTNLLVSDAGVRGLVLLNHCRAVSWPPQPYETPSLVTADAGAPLAGLAREAIARGLAGLSWAVSIPGTVAGAVVGNAGAHGHDIASVFLQARVWHQGRVTTWHHADMAFAYRSSRLKTPASSLKPRPVILDVTLALEPDAQGTAQEAAAQALAYRRRTQPAGRSAGSIFRNPPGDYAGRLLDAAGLKGQCVGDACISTKHANFILNRGQATATQVATLMRLAQEEVWRQFGVWLEPEIQLVGEWRPQDVQGLMPEVSERRSHSDA